MVSLEAPAEDSRRTSSLEEFSVSKLPEGVTATQAQQETVAQALLRRAFSLGSAEDIQKTSPAEVAELKEFQVLFLNNTPWNDLLIQLTQ